MTTPAEVLRRARRRIENGYRRDIVYAIQAICKPSGDLFVAAAAVSAFKRATGWNLNHARIGGAKGRDKAAMLAAIDRAIALAEEEAEG